MSNSNYGKNEDMRQGQGQGDNAGQDSREAGRDSTSGREGQEGATRTPSTSTSTDR